MASKRRPPTGVSQEALDALLGDTEVSSLDDMESIVGELKKALVERMLNAEMDVYLVEEDGEQAGGNNRNGRSSSKTVLTGVEQIVLNIPRDQ